MPFFSFSVIITFYYYYISLLLLLHPALPIFLYNICVVKTGCSSVWLKWKNIRILIFSTLTVSDSVSHLLVLIPECFHLFFCLTMYSKFVNRWKNISKRDVKNNSRGNPCVRPEQPMNLWQKMNKRPVNLVACALFQPVSGSFSLFSSPLWFVSEPA